MRVRFMVSAELPDGVEPETMVEYIADAVATMKGSYPPDDPLFDLDEDSITVTYLPPRKAA
jgi:hypothetical protein